MQIDSLNGNNLELKFDITYDLSCFSKIKIKNDLVKLILENKIKYKNFYIPELKYDLAIRLLEYFEYKKIQQKLKNYSIVNSCP